MATRRGRKQYTDVVPISRQPRQPIAPVKRLADLDRWVGFWVAIKNGEVIAAAETSSDLVFKMRSLSSSSTAGAVTEFVRPTEEDTYIVGVG